MKYLTDFRKTVGPVWIRARNFILTSRNLLGGMTLLNESFFREFCISGPLAVKVDASAF